MKNIGHWHWPCVDMEDPLYIDYLFKLTTSVQTQGWFIQRGSTVLPYTCQLIHMYINAPSGMICLHTLYVVLICFKVETKILLCVFLVVDYWIGLHCLQQTWWFQWVNNEPVRYTHWGRREPNNMGNEEDCVHSNHHVYVSIL